MDGSISFDSHSLQTYNGSHGIITDDIDLDNLPTKSLAIFALAHANNSELPYDGYPSKILPITGTVVGTTPSDLSTQLDLFRSYLVGRKKNLDINYGGSTRRYIATVTPNASIKRSANKKYAAFSIEFICTPPFGQDTSNTTALNAVGRTAGSYSDTYTFLGTAPYQLPVITITLTAVSSTGSKQLTFGNDDTGQTMVITRSTWASGDVVVISCLDDGTRGVTVNGVATDFSGAFPEFTPASHVMTYSDNFTSRTMTENVVYKKRYM